MKNTFSQSTTAVIRPALEQRTQDTQDNPRAPDQYINSHVNLHYLEGPLILLRGMATGTLYEFSGEYPDQTIDARDAEALLRTPPLSPHSLTPVFYFSERFSQVAIPVRITTVDSCR